MGLQEWAALFWKQISETDIIQWLAVATGVAEVIFAKANKIWLYPAGLISTLLTVYILLTAGLYAESLLNGYYVVMSIYGWWYWAKKKNLVPVAISYSNKKDWMITVLIVMLSFAVLAVILKYRTSSTVPVWDAWVAATAWAGMWLLSRRKIENWILLNISNLFAVPLLLYKQLPLFALLTVFLFIVALFGYLDWRLMIREQKIIPLSS